jgi:rod shape-determining protein MreC
VPASRLSAHRAEILLGGLLGGCLVALSVQARSPDGLRVAESWLLETSAPFLTSVNQARSAAGTVRDWFSSRRALATDNQRLRERMAGLEAENLRLRDAERDRARLLELLGAHPSPPEGTVPARLISIDTAGPFHAAILDRGLRDGVAPGSVVASSTGVLGRVVAAGSRTSRVHLLSDRLAGAGVVLARTGRVAVARGDGAGGVGLVYVPKIADVKEGDVVLTSGTDGAFPRDLPVGVVAAVGRTGPSLFLELPLTLAADPTKASIVFILPRPVREMPPQTPASPPPPEDAAPSPGSSPLPAASPSPAAEP